MNKYFSLFTIKDLENLSGVKAHTIRIWEKRYQILQPKRTDTNIRYYDLSDLKKLLNVSLLNKSGQKISYISKLSDTQINALVQDTSSIVAQEKVFIDTLVMAMLTFDQSLVDKVYHRMKETYSFQKVFAKVFIPLLNYIGLHWQSNSITPAHEHFISNQIRQKLYAQIEQLRQKGRTKNELVYVLFLPDNEIHEIGLLYLHFELLLRGMHTIYLGQSTPIESLRPFQNIFSKITYISYFTTQPITAEITNYLKDFHNELLKGKDHQLWVSGPKIREAGLELDKENMILFKDFNELLNNFQ